MRIIGGTHRGRKIKYPGFRDVRPTKDRIREAVFDIISERVAGARVLDLFAGSGAYGLESLSRGSGDTVFVDNDIRCVKIINDNLALIGAAEQARVVAKDVFKATELLGKNKKDFDLIFSDPPFNRDMAKKTLITVNQYDILSPSGLLVLEHTDREFTPAAEGNIFLFKQKTYKHILISFYRKR
ncbi:MAG: 16S rRNA (guanine(966)-N(2))-methyltransferase RsmD [Candidatus Omnitrophica bacterium]|nr:16S rRNA (guanine(966)-N(2))-methyltransferase RsmD [Candidatus Omnitrophota bacterium]